MTDTSSTIRGWMNTWRIIRKQVANGGRIHIGTWPPSATTIRSTKAQIERRRSDKIAPALTSIVLSQVSTWAGGFVGHVALYLPGAVGLAVENVHAGFTGGYFGCAGVFRGHLPSPNEPSDRQTAGHKD